MRFSTCIVGLSSGKNNRWAGSGESLRYVSEAGEAVESGQELMVVKVEAQNRIKETFLSRHENKVSKMFWCSL